MSTRNFCNNKGEDTVINYITHCGKDENGNCISCTNPLCGVGQCFEGGTCWNMEKDKTLTMGAYGQCNKLIEKYRNKKTKKIAYTYFNWDFNDDFFSFNNV